MEVYINGVLNNRVQITNYRSNDSDTSVVLVKTDDETYVHASSLARSLAGDSYRSLFTIISAKGKKMELGLQKSQLNQRK